ncbi:MAG: hypothetical protein ACE15B_22760 [Bryobacteraceae bacterium]
MKCLSVFLLTAAAGMAADFATGQAARLIIGQSQFTRQQPGADINLLGGVSGLAYANDMLFVADANRAGSQPLNHRVLIFRNLSSTLPRPTDELRYEQRCPVCVGIADTVLGQPDFKKTDWRLAQDGMRLPTAVATDGTVLAVADTDNNRILIWKTIPTRNGQPADIVVGQDNFTSNRVSIPPTNKSLRGPQGVWIQDGKLMVADTQDHRVLIWNSIPSSNGQAADVVLGQPDFTTFVEPDISQQKVDAKPTNMLNPVSVTSDGIKLFVSDLGHNRVLIWNSIPRTNAQPADVVVGQPDMTSSVANYSYKTENDKSVKVLCDPTSQDDKGNDVFPSQCEATLSFPRYALSDGTHLFIADGGNDRVLIFKKVPVSNGAKADFVIGQLGGGINQASDAADSMRTPMSLAWDGTNLYVSDSYNRRINVYSMGEHNIPYTGVRNAASLSIFAVGGITFSGKAVEGDSVTVKIADKEYTYKVKKDDTLEGIILALMGLINAGQGDPNVLATANLPTLSLRFTARAPGSDGNKVEYSITTAAAKKSESASIVGTTSGANLSGGMDAAKIAPGTIVAILGDNLSEFSESAPADATKLPDELANTQVYFDGVRAPLLMVSPTQINAQIPYEFLDTTSISAFVRTKRSDGSVIVTTPVAVTIVPQNPGIFAESGNDPRPGVAYHSSSYATGTISVDGTAKAGDIATVTIEDRAYKYTVKDGDTLDSIRDGLIELINTDPKVTAFKAGLFDRIRLRARVPGPEGNGIPFGGNAAEGGQVIISATNSALCCANVEGARITEDNPALPGETLIVYATGLGWPKDLSGVNTGEAFDGGMNEPREFVSSLAGGKTANVLYAGLQPGTVGVWRVDLELNSDLPTDPLMQLTIAQSEFVSNIITIPVVNPKSAKTDATTTP